MPSIRPTVGKFWTPLKPDPLQLGEEDRHQPERVGAADARQDRRLLHDREHLARHVDDDLVRVAVRHQPGERAAPAHPVAARVVDDDQVGAAGLGALRREARAGARADDRAAGVDLRAQPRERLGPRHDAARRISSCSRFAIARANAGSLTSASTSCTSTFEVSTIARIVVEERLVRLGIVEDLALGRDRRDAAERHEQHRRPGRGVQLLAR